MHNSWLDWALVCTASPACSKFNCAHHQPCGSSGKHRDAWIIANFNCTICNNISCFLFCLLLTGFHLRRAIDTGGYASGQSYAGAFTATHAATASYAGQQFPIAVPRSKCGSIACTAEHAATINIVCPGYAAASAAPASASASYANVCATPVASAGRDDGRAAGSAHGLRVTATWDGMEWMRRRLLMLF